MHPRSRTGAVLTAALFATVLTPLLPVATASAVAAQTEVAVFVADMDSDGSYGVYRRETPDASARALIAESDLRDVNDVSVSADGSRFVAVETSYTAAGVPLRERLVVRDISGQVVRVVEDLDANGSDVNSAPALSPDGSTVVFTRARLGASVTVAIRKAQVASGVSAQVAVNYASPVFLNATTLLVRSTDAASAGEYRTLSINGGTADLLLGNDLSADAGYATVSSDGTQLAWVFATSAETAPALTTDIQVASLSVSGITATVGPHTTIANGLANMSPAFSRDGTKVFFTKYDGDLGDGDIWSVPTAGGTAAVTPATAGDETTVAIGALDTVAPAGVTADQAFTLNGTSATVRWTAPAAEADTAGVLLLRTQRDTGTTKQVFINAPATSLVDTGLIVGKTYDYVLWSKDRSGNAGPPAGRSLTAVGALATFADPTSKVTTRAPFLVSFATAAPAGVLFTADYTINGGGYRAWIVDKPGATRTFGAATTGASATTSTPGQTYRFRVSAKDAYGNGTAQVLSGKSVVPFDQTRAALSGGTNVARGDAWLGSLRILSAAGHYARVTITGDRFQVIGERCPSCGIVDIYDGSTRIGSVDTRAASRQPRTVLYTRTWTMVGNHTLTLKPRGTAGRPNIVLDGFAVRR